MKEKSVVVGKTDSEIKKNSKKEKCTYYVISVSQSSDITINGPFTSSKKKNNFLKNNYNKKKTNYLNNANNCFKDFKGHRDSSGSIHTKITNYFSNFKGFCKNFFKKNTNNNSSKKKNRNNLDKNKNKSNFNIRHSFEVVKYNFLKIWKKKNKDTYYVVSVSSENGEFSINGPYITSNKQKLINNF